MSSLIALKPGVILHAILGISSLRPGGFMRMRLHFFAALTGVAISMGAAAQGTSTATDLGRFEFQANCASCHGIVGKGNGPLAGQLKTPPPDLTILERKNGGVFPFARVYDAIQGAAIAAHGTRDMPIWGWEFGNQASEYSLETSGSKEQVQARILALLEYLNRLQQK